MGLQECCRTEARGTGAGVEWSTPNSLAARPMVQRSKNQSVPLIRTLAGRIGNPRLASLAGSAIQPESDPLPVV